jgi:hypothetical protein
MIAALTANLWRAAALALAAITLGLLVYIHGLPVIGGGLKATIAQKNLALEKAASDLRAASGELEGARVAIGRQNAAVARLEAERAASAQRAAKALSEAQRANSRADEALGRIKARKPVGCETGREIMEAPL